MGFRLPVVDSVRSCLPQEARLGLHLTLPVPTCKLVGRPAGAPQDEWVELSHQAPVLGALALWGDSRGAASWHSEAFAAFPAAPARLASES